MTAAAPGRVLVVTNDFPPRRGGIESFVFALCAGLPPEQVVVYTSRMRGAAAVDRAVAYPVVRDTSRILLPTPRVARAVQDVARTYGCDRVVFGAAMPLGLLAGGLRTAGVHRLVGLTHGHEVWWAALPLTRALVRRVGREVDVLTYVSGYCRDRVATALRPTDAAAMIRLSPGVDTRVFSPAVDGSALRRRLGIEPDQPVVVAAARLVARKGHDVLLQAWPEVLASHPRAVLLLVGDGPARHRLTRASVAPGLRGSVLLLPGVDWREMPEVYGAGTVFALPCRTRLLGLEPEALGIVFLEAAAAGLPVVVGRSGGAPETVLDGTTGFVVNPQSPGEVAAGIDVLLSDPAAAAAMGRRGREWVAEHYSWDSAVATLRSVVAIPADCPD